MYLYIIMCITCCMNMYTQYNIVICIDIIQNLDVNISYILFYDIYHKKESCEHCFKKSIYIIDIKMILVVLYIYLTIFITDMVSIYSMYAQYAMRYCLRH